jgi:uncharacterized protein (TIGR03086 family)
MDSVAMLGRVVEQTQRVVDGVTPEQLGQPSPCEEWTVRDVINHITGGATMFAISAEKGSIPDEDMGRIMGGDNLGDDYKGAFRAASRRALDVYNQPGVLDKNVTLPFGEMPAGVALDIAIFDVATHAADIARATGQAIEDEQLLEDALTMGRTMLTPQWRAPGVFGDEQPVADDAPVADRLLAFAGRRI